MVKWSERHDKDTAYKGGFDPRLFDDWEFRPLNVELTIHEEVAE